MGEMLKQDWLIGLAKQATWIDNLCFLYLLLLSVHKILVSSQLSLCSSL
jgi:hypothetical protein